MGDESNDKQGVKQQDGSEMGRFYSPFVNLDRKVFCLDCTRPQVLQAFIDAQMRIACDTRHNRVHYLDSHHYD